MNDPKRLTKLLGAQQQPSREQLMREIPLPDGYFDRRS